MSIHGDKEIAHIMRILDPIKSEFDQDIAFQISPHDVFEDVGIFVPSLIETIWYWRQLAELYREYVQAIDDLGATPLEDEEQTYAWFCFAKQARQKLNNYLNIEKNT